MLGAPLFPGTDGIDGIGDGDDQPGDSDGDDQPGDDDGDDQPGDGEGDDDDDDQPESSITPYFFTTRTANGGTAAKPRATSVQRNGGGSR